VKNVTPLRVFAKGDVLILKMQRNVELFRQPLVPKALFERHKPHGNRVLAPRLFKRTVALGLYTGFGKFYGSIVIIFVIALNSAAHNVFRALKILHHAL
jgi:hypothetical protein